VLQQQEVSKVGRLLGEAAGVVEEEEEAWSIVAAYINSQCEKS
jgi:hypothetical protein